MRNQKEGGIRDKDKRMGRRRGEKGGKREWERKNGEEKGNLHCENSQR